MDKSLVVTGRLEDPRHILLDEPVENLIDATQLVVRLSPPQTSADRPADVFRLIAGLPPGGRSKSDIDSQLAEERGSWGES